MITRLCAMMMLIGRMKAELKEADCAVRVDILDGADLTPGLSVFLTEKTPARDTRQCALLCHSRHCDVAYFHSSRGECQFTPESSSGTSPDRCRLLQADLSNDVKTIDNVKRYCIRCSEQPKNNAALQYHKAVPTRPPSLSIDWQRANLQNWTPAVTVNGRVVVPSRPMQPPPVVYQIDRDSYPSRRTYKTMQSMASKPRRLYRIGQSRYRKRTKNQQRMKFRRRFFHHSTAEVRVDNVRTKYRGNGLARRRRSSYA